MAPPTVRQWLNVLEASHQIALLRPHFENFGKRLINSPKLYWLDTGLAAGKKAGDGLVIADVKWPSSLVPGVRVLPWHAI